jgi:hypothetical protein
MTNYSPANRFLKTAAIAMMVFLLKVFILASLQIDQPEYYCRHHQMKWSTGG